MAPRLTPAKAAYSSTLLILAILTIHAFALASVAAPPPMQSSLWNPGQERVIYAFKDRHDGRDPAAGLIAGVGGALYGTTNFGGGKGCLDNIGCGVVFELTPSGPDAYIEKIVYVFRGGSDGENPSASLMMDADGALYGTTQWGGGSTACNVAGQLVGCGTVFKLTPTVFGTYVERVLYRFQGGFDGADAASSVVQDSNGALYGTTQFGGPNNNGTVYRLTPKGSDYSEQLLHVFGTYPDGLQPAGGVVIGANGVLYGTTSGGGNDFWGTVFALRPTVRGAYTESIILNLIDAASWPYGGLVIDGTGAMYGTTTGGSTAYKLVPSASGYRFSILYSFGSKYRDGYAPRGTLVVDDMGRLFGTTVFGGRNRGSCDSNCGMGTVFELTPERHGTLFRERVLHRFYPGRDHRDGKFPYAGLLAGKHGELFGTTAGGGYGGGTVFEVVP